MASQINASNSGFGGIVSTGDSSGVLQLQTTGTTAVTIDTSQNVGIGTTSPATKLQVVGASGSLNARINAGNTGLDITSNDATGVTDVATSPLGAGGKVMTFTTYNGSSSAERMRITSSGQLLLSSNPSQLWFGDTSTGSFLQGTNTGGYLVFATSGTEKMRISGTSLCINNTSSPGGQPLYVKATAGVGSAGFQVQANGSGAIDWYNVSATYVASVIVNASSVAYNTTSDYRLKNEIVPMTGALDKVAQLKPVNWKWKLDGSNGQGFIAHELQAVIPDAVSGEKDAVDAEGNPKYQGVDTSFLVATLTAAIQEQQTIINDLKARIETLEAK